MLNISRPFYYFFISIIVLISWPLKLSGATTAELYQAQVPVASYSSADFNKALGPALIQVLVKLSGNSSVANLPSIKKALEKPDRYLQSYNYSSTASDGTAKLSVIARFSPKSINGLLQAANQPVVDRSDTTMSDPEQLVGPSEISTTPISAMPLSIDKDESQTVLVWLVIKNAAGQPEVLNYSAHPIVTAMQVAAQRQNISLLWPVMDLQDVSIVSPMQIWQLDRLAVEQASRRYQVNQVLIGKLEPENNGQWQGTWMWLAGMKSGSHWNTQGADAPEAAVSTLPNLKDASKTMSSTPTSSQEMGDYRQSSGSPVSDYVELKVSDVYNLNDYANLIKYFRSLRSISGVSAAQSQGDTVVLKVKLKDTKEMFIEELDQGQRLLPESLSVSVNNIASDLSYRWNESSVSQDLYENPAVQSFPAAEPENSFSP